MSPRSKDVKVWRYMSFGRFVWLLKKKALWMSRVDLLGDAWEMSYSAIEMQRALTPKPEEHLDAEALELQRRLFDITIRAGRSNTFVNCWTASSDESHAMWSVYCKSIEGVAVQTTLNNLRQSVEKYFPVAQVRYERYTRINTSTVNFRTLATRKRKPYAFEREYRIIAYGQGIPEIFGVYSALGPNDTLIHPDAFALRWKPEAHINRILVHPGADAAMLTSVRAVVQKFAPSPSRRVVASAMAELPPV